jgi:signal transduction histidine kinase/ActR/RegA family two-component response regulator
MDPQKRIEELEKRIKELEEKLVQTQNEAENANYSKTMFLANMSHEIRTPMNSIIGIYNLLNQSNLTSEQRELLEIINISSYNLLAIINDILDHSKIEAGQLNFEHKPFLLHDEIHHVIKLLSIKAKGKGIELVSRIESRVPACVWGDPVRLSQIMINLTNNALKYTLEGNVTLSVDLISVSEESFLLNREFIPEFLQKHTDVPADHVIIKFTVSDTGIGISPEEQAYLFTEYTQIENPLIHKYEGSGLGLSISRNLTRLMNGRFGLISTLGKGSTFWFTILFQQESEDIIDKNKQLTFKPKSNRPLHILIVEDNLLNQKFAVTTLERANHMVDIAENGKNAVEKFKTTPYDMILMDIAMPIMDGLEATRAIRKIEADRKLTTGINSSVKILAVTAHVLATDREKCISAGMDDYLAKPFRPNDLLNMIYALTYT